MLETIIGSKVRQTQQFTENGKRIPVTIVQVGPQWVTAIRTINDKHYIQLGFGTQKHLTKALEGHIKKAGIQEKPRFLRQFAVSELGEIKVGDQINIEELFKPGDAIRVTGTSKGKGFAGVMKRHGFKGGPATHGQSDRARSPGSIGQTTTPGRVYRGKRMAGRMGSDTVTVRGLEIISVNQETKQLTIRGLIPGGKNAVVVIKKEQ